MKTEIIKIEGMSCGHCVNGVNNAIKEVEGVQNVDVSLENAQATVTFDDAKTSLDKIKQAVNDTDIYKAL